MQRNLILELKAFLLVPLFQIELSQQLLDGLQCNVLHIASQRMNSNDCGDPVSFFSRVSNKLDILCLFFVFWMDCHTTWLTLMVPR